MTTAFDRVLDLLEGVKRRGNKATARCPAHGDRNASLSLKNSENGSVLMYCHAGCENVDVMAAIGMTLGDLYDNREGETYRYDDGRQVRRKYVNGKKEFPQSGNKNGQSTLYRLSTVTEAVKNGKTIMLVEGEKDVHALESLAIVATTAPMGAANFNKVDASPLYGAEIIAIVDNDEQGEKVWVPQVLAALEGKAASLDFMKAAVGKDASDHIAAGLPLDQLIPWPPPEPNQDPTEPDEPQEENILEVDVAKEAYKLKVRKLAREKHAQEKAGNAPLPDFIGLEEFLNQPTEENAQLIKGLWNKDTPVMLAAQWKAGKTTVRDNIIKCLADGGRFLGKFDAEPLTQGRIVVLDLELSQDMMRDWLKAHSIINQDRVVVVPMRGQAHSLNLLVPEIRTRWAARLRGWNARVLLLDCLRPALDGLGLSEDKDAGRFLNAGFDPLLREAGELQGMVIHHMGHTMERARGDSSMLGWGDSWRLIRKDEDPASPRYFTAYGRDINVPESELSYDTATRTLAIVGGSRKDSTADFHWRAIRAYIKEHPDCSQTQVVKAFGKDQAEYEPISERTVREVIRRAIRRHELHPGHSPNGKAMKLNVTDLGFAGEEDAEEETA
jgi:5S rRNA maturation endonuclease (ribonuclease M5)